MTFGEKLYQLRKGRGMSQEALARELNVARQAISRWELGEVVPDTVNVLAISRLFGVSTDYLLREDCEQERDTPAVQNAEADLQRRTRAANLGLLFRTMSLSCALCFNLWLVTENPAWKFGTVLWLAVSVAGLAWWNHRWYIKEHGNLKLLKWDLPAVLLAFFLPRFLTWIPGNWGCFLGGLPSILLQSTKIRVILYEHYQVSPKKREPRGPRLK